MTLRTEVLSPVTDHGGSLDSARRRFPGAPEPWIDLSTGINPHAYPQLDLPTSAFTRLPEPARIAELCTVAAQNYGAPSAANVVAAPGTQILLPRVAALVSPGRARVLGPTYAEHVRAAALTGHQAAYVGRFEQLYEADLAILVNPNNPDGRIVERERLLNLSRHLRDSGGLLVVDEAFMDVGPREQSLAGDVEEAGAVVLKSFGKFFGLAGVRLGFALAPRGAAERLSGELGPWAVAGPALEYGLAGLADRSWQDAMRGQLAAEAAMLDELLAAAGLPVSGGTSLFRYLETPLAQAAFEALGQAGILSRRFDDLPHALRFGLPAGEPERRRLAAALQNMAFSASAAAGHVIASAAE
jgi:cobalamin biosynthetic protein CobC